MNGFDVREFLQAASAAAVESGSGQSTRRQPAAALEGAAGAPARPSYSPVVIEGLVRIIEFFLVAFVGVATHRIYLAGVIPFDFTYLVLVVGLASLTVVVLQAAGAYAVSAFRAFFLFGLRILAAWTLVILIALMAVFFLKIGGNVSRVWLASLYVAGAGALILERLVLSIVVSRMTRAGRFDRRTAIVGGGDAAEAIIKRLDAQPESGIRVVGVFDDRGEDRSPEVIAGYPKLGTVDDLVDYARRTQLDLVIFTLPISAEKRILQMLAKLWVLPIDIRLSAHTSKLRLRPRAYSYIGSVPVLDVFDKPIADWDLVLKWLFDKVVGSILLILVSPILLMTAIAVKLDSRGPVLFRQKRYGFNNELIEVFKFRSMHVDQCDPTASRLVTKGDPRVTRVGRFIRKTSIDELPQLFNVVFKGDLSLVGPRPHAIHAKAENRLYDQVVDGYFARHKVKPGITGWAQVNGWRGETDTEEKIQRRVEYDLYYIENWSVFFDIYILAVTPFALFKSDNAY